MVVAVSVVVAIAIIAIVIPKLDEQHCATDCSREVGSHSCVESDGFSAARGFGEELRSVVVPALLTACRRVADVLPVRLLSPSRQQ